MTIPVALKSLLGIVFSFQGKELGELRVAFLQLLPLGKPVIGEVVAPSPRRCQIDQGPEGVGGAVHSLRGMFNPQVENNAGVGFPRPGKKAFAVLLDQAHGAVDDRYSRVPQEPGGFLEEIAQLISRHVDLGDHQAGGNGGSLEAVDLFGVVGEIGAQLVGVRPIDLAMGPLVVGSVGSEGCSAVGMGEEEQVHPLAF